MKKAVVLTRKLGDNFDKVVTAVVIIEIDANITDYDPVAHACSVLNDKQAEFTKQFPEFKQAKWEIEIVEDTTTLKPF